MLRVHLAVTALLANPVDAEAGVAACAQEMSSAKPGRRSDQQLPVPAAVIKDHQNRCADNPQCSQCLSGDYSPPTQDG